MGNPRHSACCAPLRPIGILAVLRLLRRIEDDAVGDLTVEIVGLADHLPTLCEQRYEVVSSVGYGNEKQASRCEVGDVQQNGEREGERARPEVAIANVRDPEHERRNEHGNDRRKQRRHEKGEAVQQQAEQDEAEQQLLGETGQHHENDDGACGQAGYLAVYPLPCCDNRFSPRRAAKRPALACPCEREKHEGERGAGNGCLCRVRGQRDGDAPYPLGAEHRLLPVARSQPREHDSARKAGQKQDTLRDGEVRHEGTFFVLIKRIAVPRAH